MVPTDSTIRFAECLLTQAQALEWAAARYDANGRVAEVWRSKLVTRDLNALRRLLPWLKHQNGNGKAIWCRPEDAEHPWLMLDDLSTALGYQLSKKYATLVIETSPGNAQALLLADRVLTAEERMSVRRSLSAQIGADPGAISEPRWSRAPGFRSGKSGRPWTNLLTETIACAARFAPGPWLTQEKLPAQREASPTSASVALRRRGEAKGEDASGKEFAFACRALEAGLPPDEVIARVVEHASARGKRADQLQTQRYAEQLVAAARKACRWPC